MRGTLVPRHVLNSRSLDYVLSVIAKLINKVPAAIGRAHEVVGPLIQERRSRAEECLRTGESWEDKPVRSTALRLNHVDHCAERHADVANRCCYQERLFKRGHRAILASCRIYCNAHDCYGKLCPLPCYPYSLTHAFAPCRRVSLTLCTTSRPIHPWLSPCVKKSKQFWPQKVAIGARVLSTSSRRLTAS